MGKGSASSSSAGTSTGGSGGGSHCNKGRRARGMYTGAVASTAARYSTAQGSATAAASRSTAATLRSADAREGRSGELPRKRREDVAEGWTRAARGILPIAGRRWPGRRGAGPGTDSSARASDGARSQPVAQFSRLLVSFFIFSIVLVLGQGHQETSWVDFCPCLICADWKKRKLQGVLSTYTNSTTNILPWSQQGLDRPTVFNQGNCLLSGKKKFEADVHVAIFFFFIKLCQERSSAHQVMIPVNN